MNIKKMTAALVSAAMAFVTAVSAAATSSAKLVPSENPDPGLFSEERMWFLTLRQTVQPSIRYDIDYSKVAKYSVTFTVLEEDRELWNGDISGTIFQWLKSDDIPDYVTDENGSPVYETDENGDIVYETRDVLDENGNIITEFVTDEEGNKVPKKKEHPLHAKYCSQATSYHGVKDEELGIDTSREDGDHIYAEKTGDYTYKLTSDDFANPIAAGDAQSIAYMQLAFCEWGFSETETHICITNVDVMDSDDNVLISFDGNGKVIGGNAPAPEPNGAFAVVENPELPLVVTTPTAWYALGYSEGKAMNGETNEPYPSLEFDIDYSKVAKLSVAFAVVEEDRDIFDGQCGGGLSLSISGGDIAPQNKELWDKYIWQGYEWWGVNDDALGFKAADKDMIAEKIGDYTYRITTRVLDNPLANGDTTKLDHMMFGVQEWGSNKAKIKVLQLDVMDNSGNVLLSYDANGKATIPDTSIPDTSVPDTSIPDTSNDPSSTPSTPDTSSALDNTSEDPDKVIEFVPIPGVDEAADEETAKVIAEIKVSAPEAAFEASTTLTVKKIDSVGGENAFALDIIFMLNGTAVQPKDGTTVTVSIPVPPKFKDVNEDLLKVFHYLNGKYTKIEATVKNGTVTFDTTHFSTYVISPDDLTANNPPESSTVAPETPNPSTGVAAVSVLPIAAIVGAVVIISKKKK